MITLAEATQLTGKSRSTLTRAIRSGKLAARRDDDDKTYLVDPAELARVFTVNVTNRDSSKPAESARHDSPTPPGATNQTHQGVSQQPAPVAHHDSPNEPINGGVVNHDELIDAWKRIAETEQSRADDLAATVDDLQSRLDRSESERQQLSATVTALLPAPDDEPSSRAAPPPETQAPGGFWSRVFGW